MIEILQYGFMQKALLAGLLVSISTSLLGVFLILRRLSLLGDGLAHAAFGGVAVGFLFNINPLMSALVFSALGSLGINKLIKRTKVYGDSAIALVLATGMALAVVIIGYVRGFNANLFSYLFGSILSVSNTDLLILGTVTALVILFVATSYRKLLVMTFNEDLAYTKGINVGLLHTILIVLCACAIVVAVRAVGILLVTGLIVIPSLSALNLSDSFKKTLIFSVGISIISMLLGIILAFVMDLPPGGMIVLTNSAFFFATLLGKHHRTS